MWHLFVPLVNQKSDYSKHSSRGAFGDIFRLGPQTTNHGPRVTKKRAFYLFYIFNSKCGNHFFLERLTPWDSRERCVSLSGAYFFFSFFFFFWRRNRGTRKWIRAYFVAIWWATTSQYCRHQFRVSISTDSYVGRDFAFWSKNIHCNSHGGKNRHKVKVRYLNNNHDSNLYLVSLPYFPCSPILTYRYSHTHSHTSA